MAHSSIERRAKVAIFGGGCAAITAAFELTRPEHDGRFEVTLYQQGWRLGGKGASGRGPADRIEEHGLHVWMGFYENAFRLLRECYAELGRDRSQCPIADWEDAFFPEPAVGFADRKADGTWLHHTAAFPPAPGLPGDPLDDKNPFTVGSYLMHTVKLLRTLLTDVQTGHAPSTAAVTEDQVASVPSDPALDNRDAVIEHVTRLFRYGVLSTTGGLVTATSVLGAIFKSLPTYPQNVVLDLLSRVAATVRMQLERVLIENEKIVHKWEVIDLVIAIMVGIVRDGLYYHPKGFDAINHYECLDWLRMNGASERSLKSGFVRGLYDLAFAYGEAGPDPGLAAGQAIRGSLRMMFTYRGAMFWKMRAGMGDVVFAPFYEVLKNRGVRFEFFHRLEHVRVTEPAMPQTGERPFIHALEVAVQAKIRNGAEYEPLVDIRGLPCWPSAPDYSQLVGGRAMAREQRDFESDWERRKAATKTLRVGRDFDFVVLAIGIGAVPQVCADIVARDERWRSMVENVKTVETQAFQLWLREDMNALGWPGAPVTLSGYVNPFNTWADMRQLISMESFAEPPRAIAYFCNRLSPDPTLDPEDPTYPARRREQVKKSALRFLNRDLPVLWPKASTESGTFRWDLLVSAAPDGANVTDERRFESQYWAASVNRSDRYVLAGPGSLEHRISPLDETYDNLTVAGDWTDCGFNEGCVEAAVISGRLAAHALAQAPALEEIIGFDHP
jgi:uncharacterized protein with NAD-binding domain and iron-sulfur cluster